MLRVKPTNSLPELDVLVYDEVRALLRERVMADSSRLYASASIVVATFDPAKTKCLPGMLTDESYERAISAFEEVEYAAAVRPYVACGAVAAADKSFPIVLPPVVEVVAGDTVVVFGLDTYYAMLERGDATGTVPCILVRHVVGVPPVFTHKPEPLPRSMGDYITTSFMERDRGAARRLVPAY